MNTTLSQKQIGAYRRDGFVAHRGFLDCEEVEELKSAVLSAIETMGKSKVAGGGGAFEDGDTYYDRVFTQRLNLWRISETVKRYMLNSKLGEMLSALEGVDSFRVWHDKAVIKEPYANPTAWHLDDPFWPFYTKHAISIWIALGPATLGNGCMWFVPGSHKLARFETADIGENLSDLFELYTEMTNVDPEGVPMEEGDCSFHNGLTAHGAGANMTRGRRIAMTCNYMPVGSTFNGKCVGMPPEYFASLSEGDVLDNDEWNPVV